MNAASAADQSDPGRNVHFRRRWTGPPPKNRLCRPGASWTAHVDFIGSITTDTISQADAAAQRAIAFAETRARYLEDRAVLLASIGLTDAAERLAAVAEELREVAT